MTGAEAGGKKDGDRRTHFYKQEIDAEKVQDKFDDSLRDITEFDSLTSVADESFTFSDRVYYHGWSEGDNIVLLYKDEDGRRQKELHPFEWYFFIRTEEAETVPREKWDWLCNHHAERVEPDPRFPDRYWRVYVRRTWPKLDRKKCFARIGDPERGEMWMAPFVLGERPFALRFPYDRERWDHIHHVIRWLERKGIEPLEADLSPKQRFLTDHDVNIQANYRTAFFDLETDDSVGGFEFKEQGRILSVAWEGDQFDKDPDDCGYIRLEEHTDEAERAMLMEFKRRVLDRYDLVAAWNGFGFDFPVLIARFEKMKIFYEWRKILFVDPLPVFKRHYVRAGSDATSFRLDAIGEKILKMRKVDWRAKFREDHPGVTPTFLNLWKHAPDLLEEYNRYDAKILRKLEAFTGFVSVEQIFCRLSNGFANDWNISTKIDQLLLKKGYKEGHHFTTRFATGGRPDQYEGAHVFDPDVGMHRNVVAFDFKSLYPSMVRAFNVSPETIVKGEDREKFGPEGLCRAPVVEVKDGEGGTVKKGGATFRLDREGYISQMFVRTLERRKKYTELQDKRVREVGTTQDDLFLLYYRLAYSFKRLGLSFYGDLGNPRSRYYDTDAAEAITLSGQFFIKETAKFAEEENGYKVRYGDSITGPRNVVVLDPGDRLRVLPVREFWDMLRGLGAPVVEDRGKEFLEVPDGWRALSAVSQGVSDWARISRLVRHKSGKPVFRLTTPEGQVEVTADHGVTVERDGRLAEETPAGVLESGRELVKVPLPPVRLLEEVDLREEIGSFSRKTERMVYGRWMKRSEVRLGTLEGFLQLVWTGDLGYAPAERHRFRRHYRVGTPELNALLELLGIYCAEGSVSAGSADGKAGGFRIGLDDVEYVSRLADCLRLVMPTFESQPTADGRILQCRHELPSLIFSRLCGVGSSGKRVPDFVYHLPQRERRIFLEAYLYGDGSFYRRKPDGRPGPGSRDAYDLFECGSVSLDLSSGISVLTRGLGVPFSVKAGRSKLSGSETYGIRSRSTGPGAIPGRSNLAKVSLERVEDPGEYVYDLEVPGTQRFTEAYGCVSLHNTDSVYIQLMPSEQEWEDPDQRIADINAAADRFVAYCQERYEKLLAGFNCNLAWNTVLLEYEDVFDKIIFVSKKRYAGRMLLHKGAKTDHIEVKGLEMMRSDVPEITRRFQERVLRAILLEDKSAAEIQEELVGPEFERAVSGKLTMEEIVIGKGLSRDPFKYKGTLLHVTLAKELKAGGHEFYVGMKIEYVVTGHKPKLQGVTRQVYEDGGHVYDASYYWDKVIYPATKRILEVAFPEEDWGQFEVMLRERRRKLVKQMETWLMDPKRAAKAVAKIREEIKTRRVLGPREIAHLRRAPRIRLLAS